MNSLEIVSASYSQSADDLETKKVRFKEDGGIMDVEMIEDSGSPSNGSDSPAKASWKQMLLGKRKHNQDERLQSVGKDSDGDFEFLEGEVSKTMVNDIPTIEFSEAYGVQLKPLYHFLAKLKCIEDYNKAPSQRPWIIYGQYLTIQLWTKYFNPNKPYSSMVLAWIRLPSLLGFMYKRRILEEVGGLVGKVVKFDLNTDSKTRGRLARMVIFIYLNKPLVSQVMVNGELQNVEYEALPTICFACKKYGYFKDQCSSPTVEKNNVSGEVSGNVVNLTFEGKGSAFSPWMVVERKSRGVREICEIKGEKIKEMIDWGQDFWS
ncbi:hypothetical protein Goarm_013347 [Gossypium armourianum]|uniref:DUF4283 domain-containing protein n=1 Tax=Gossypium armourianum TaxID=34283 RepID=A0A7J9J4C6_9ROSI|nr:hypothetical protein [Gossypium armourianum]